MEVNTDQCAMYTMPSLAATVEFYSSLLIAKLMSGSEGPSTLIGERTPTRNVSTDITLVPYSTHKKHKYWMISESVNTLCSRGWQVWPSIN